MSLLESIDAFITDQVNVTRTPAGPTVGGIYQTGTPLPPFPVAVSIQPATGLQRVVGGRDMRFNEDGELAYDVRQIFTRFPLTARTPAFDPDLIDYDGSTWTVFRVEPWTIDGETFYRCVITREMKGAS